MADGDEPEEPTQAEAVPEEVPVTPQTATGKVRSRWFIEQRLDAIERRLAEGNRTLAVYRTQLEHLTDQITPRVTLRRVVSWAAAIILPIAAIVFGWGWTAGSFPSKTEMRELDNRERALELRVIELSVRVSTMAATK